MTYRFLGTESNVGSVRLQSLGQPVELEESVAHEMILGGGSAQAFAGAVPLLPADHPAWEQFEDQELLQYAHPGARDGAPDAVKQKLRNLAVKLHEFRLSLEGSKDGE